VNIIYSKHHFLISVFVGLLLGILVTNSVPLILFTALYAGLIGVIIDIDHFVISRLHSGDWSAAKNCLRSPLQSLIDQEDIFGEKEVGPAERVLSHLLISGILVSVIWIVTPRWSFVTGVILYVHILTDSYADASGYFD
jgi:hypothetical protein